MRNLIFLLFLSTNCFGQIINNIENITINLPCKLQKLNNNSCTIKDDNNYIYQYSITVIDHYDSMKEFNEKTLNIYKDQFIESTLEDAKIMGESGKLIKLQNTIDAVKTNYNINFSNNIFNNTTISFLHKNKSYHINFTTNNTTKSENLQNLIRLH